MKNLKEVITTSSVHYFEVEFSVPLRNNKELIANVIREVLELLNEDAEVDARYLDTNFNIVVVNVKFVDEGNYKSYQECLYGYIVGRGGAV